MVFGPLGVSSASKLTHFNPSKKEGETWVGKATLGTMSEEMF
jgi:hypothetical protein